MNKGKLNVAVLQKAVDDLSKSEQNTEAWQEAMDKVKEAAFTASPASPASTAQRYAYQITINNPQTYGCDHLTIKRTLIDNFPTLRYFCMADEIGENGTYHTHIYVCFTPVCASAQCRSTLIMLTLHRLSAPYSLISNI